MKNKEHLKRIRMLSALGDFDLAISAVTFIMESDENQNYDLPELRRFRCYEHSAIISYGRPFSQSNALPKLSLKQCNVKPTLDEQSLHDRLISLRNKLVAHSDFETMNFTVSPFASSILEEPSTQILLPRYDESLVFANYLDQVELRDWITKVSFGLYKKLSAQVQNAPDDFRLRVLNRTRSD